MTKRKKYTTEEVKQIFIKEKFIPHLTEYKATEKINYTCPKGHPGSIKLTNFLSGKRCDKCRRINTGLKNRLTEDDYRNKLLKFNQTFLSFNDGKIKFKCPLNHPNECSYLAFRGRRYKCRECGKNSYKGVLGYEGAKKKFEDINYTLLTKESEYKGTDQILEYLCDNNHKNKMTVGLLMSGLRCTICSDTKPVPYTYEEILEETKIFNCELIECDYKNIYSKIKIKCPENHVTETQICSWLQSVHKCSDCFIKRRAEKNSYDYDYIFNFFAEKRYKLLSKEYINGKELLDVMCPIGHKIQISYSNFYGGTGCDKCNQSVLERITEDILIKMKVTKIKKQKTFDECRLNLKSKLRFDFRVNSDFLIECDGKQHFEPIEYFGGLEAYDLQVKKDSIKDQYCIDNNIPLLRISYNNNKDIEKIIKYFIENLEYIRSDKVPIYWSDQNMYNKPMQKYSEY